MKITKNVVKQLMKVIFEIIESDTNVYNMLQILWKILEFKKKNFSKKNLNEKFLYNIMFFWLLSTCIRSHFR